MTVALPSHEELTALFEKDPKAFEEKRQELINAHIEDQPKENREALREVQARVDSKLQVQ